MTLLDFCKDIIEGVGGLHDFERYEWATPNYNRDVSVAIWVIKCLANPKCDGSADMLDAISKRRELQMAEDNIAKGVLA